MFWEIVRRVLPVVRPLWLERRRIAAARRRYQTPPDFPANVGGTVFVDLTVIARRDMRTGIQRVVRSTVGEMCAHPGSWSIKPVQLGNGGVYHSAWPYPSASTGEPIRPVSGDIFLGLDLSLDAIRKDARNLLRLKRAGVRFWFVVYDLLPVESPQDFSSKVAVRFQWWLSAVAKLADGFFCISPHVAVELRMVLTDRLRLTEDVPIHVVPMGFNIPEAVASDTPTGALDAIADARRIVLAVGTVEPRKGYNQVLDAFELLWAENSDAVLVIVGTAGWKTDDLQQRIETHPEHRRRLHWLSSLNDQDLAALYDRAELLLAASYGEGFGLPVIEAIARSCPVLARDIVAFRAHEGLGVRFFPQDADRRQLADAVTALLDEGRRKDGGDRIAPPPTWRETATGILQILARSQENLPKSAAD